MKKIILSILLIFSMCFCLFGCENLDNLNSSSEPKITLVSGFNEAELYGPYDVVRVVDGDTIIVNIDNNETRVRLIGVNTPESVHPDETKNTEEGKTASDFTKNLLKNKKVYLEYDVDEEDDYNRTLAYVYLDDKLTMVNKLLIEKGYAEPMTVEPNTKYALEFEFLNLE